MSTNRSIKIKEIRIKGFKGFSSEISLDFTKKGKNLVIYGENGSGKTSIMEALKILFDSAAEEKEIEKYKNIFTNENPEIILKTTEGKEIKLRTEIKQEKDETGKFVDKTFTDKRSYSEDQRTYLKALSSSTAILSYRELMKIYDIKTDEDFFDLFVKKIMAYYLIPPRKEKTLLEELQDLEKLKKESPKAKKRIKEKEEFIISKINEIFSRINNKWNEYVKTLTGDKIEIDCAIEKLGKLKFKVRWNDKEVTDILTYLNEGRLNAIALGLFLAYYQKFNVSPYKLLLLDDVVIGLDMNLRIPLLDILEKDFEKEYQIILTTFDENWFDLIKNYLDQNKWEFRKLVIRYTDNKNYPFFIGVEYSDYLQKAKEYSRIGDLCAAALYARLEFERLVRNYADKEELKIPFKKNSYKTPIKRIWEEVKKKVMNSLPEAEIIIKKIDFYRSILLNPSVHYDQRPKYKNEVEQTIETIETLKKIIKKLS
ncbi:MAG: AAA family ATPase [Candidatus Thermoplasmatota archaeon]